MDYQAIFFDFDGTLCSFKTHTVPKSAIEGIERAQRRGVKVFLATGRHPLTFMQNDAAAALSFDAYLTANGQYCYDSQKIIHKMYIDPADKRALVKLLEHESIPMLFQAQKEIYLSPAVETDSRVLAVNSVLSSMEAPAYPIERCLHEDVFTLMLYGGGVEERRVLSVMPNTKAVRWHPLFADLIPKCGGKDVGMDAMLAYYGIPLEATLAFGDAQNDIDMLRHAGLGVAMGNASSEVKAIADMVTDSVDDDGVYKALERLGIC